MEAKPTRDRHSFCATLSPQDYCGVAETSVSPSALHLHCSHFCRDAGAAPQEIRWLAIGLRAGGSGPILQLTSIRCKLSVATTLPLCQEKDTRGEIPTLLWRKSNNYPGG